MIEREERNGIIVLRLAHGKANVLDLEFLERLEKEFDALREIPGGVVLTGRGTIFSAGVDLFRLTSGEEHYVDRFVHALDRLFHTLFDFPRPVVAAVNGHAIAGGCIMAQACDYRLMANGNGRIGVPELLVGVPFPPLALEILRFALPPQNLQRLVLTGETVDPAAAFALGLVDDLTPPEDLLERAIEIARKLAAVPQESFTITKTLLRSDVHRRMESAGTINAAIATVWRDPKIHAHIRQYLERTVGKK